MYLLNIIEALVTVPFKEGFGCEWLSVCPIPCGSNNIMCVAVVAEAD